MSQGNGGREGLTNDIGGDGEGKGMDGEERELLEGLILRLATKIVYSARSTEVHQQQL